MNAGEIADIPDLDEDGPHDDEERIAQGLGCVSLGGGGGGGGEGVGMMETPDLDDIPDMEEDDLEEGDDEAMAAVPKASVIPAVGAVDARYVFLGLLKIKKSADGFFVVLMWKLQRAICFKSGPCPLKKWVYHAVRAVLQRHCCSSFLSLSS